MNKFGIFTKNDLCKAHGKVSFYSMLCKLPTINPPPDPVTIDDKPNCGQKVSLAMKLYVDKVNKYNEFMKEQKSDFEIGKRHLANMMGYDPETFTQEDIDKSIEYLFPCGLFQKKARPIMKPPHEIFPPKKEAEFDVTGRPFHFLFYTCSPYYYQILHDAVKVLKELENYEDKVISGEIKNSDMSSVTLDGSMWISQKKLEKQLCEKVDENKYRMLMSILERIVVHPYSKSVEEFITKFREFLTTSEKSHELQIPVLLEDGRQRIRLEWQSKKNARAHVTVTYPGTGEISIDGKGIDYFNKMQSKEQVLFPLVLSKMLNKVDIEAEVLQGEGESAIVGALRLGISRGIAHFVDPDTKEKMRLAGLLQRDFRRRERKKPGQPGARRQATWRKR